MTDYRTVTAAADVTDADLEAALDVLDDHYPDGPIDWHDFLGYLEKAVPELDLGNAMDTPAIRRIQRHVRANRIT